MSEDGYDVVELKSSRKFPSFSRMVWSNHKAQALLYRLLLEEAIPSATRAQGQTSILYSAAKADEGPIRHVLSEPETTEVLMAVRNRIVLTECLMAESSGPTRTHELLEPIMEGRDRLNLAGFTADHARCVASAWLGCDAVESAWGHEYLRFIAKELRLNLIGKPGAFSVPGSQASIWRASLRAKRVAGCLLDDLSAEPVNPEDPSRLKLRLPALLSGADPGEANFREGDALLLYPRHRTKEPGNQRLSPLQSQILKVTLERFVEDGVIVNLMNRLVSPSFFRDHDLWALEPSMYDTFRQEWAGITGLLALPADQRCRLLGRTPPRQPQMDPPRELDEVDAALAAPDYYLLCGPPGTGKTSTALQRIVEGLFRSGKTILLAAYTRRAVDEICAMLEKLCKDPAFDYVRMTTPLYTDPAYHARLLETRLAACTTRVGVRELLLRCRIFVGTVSGLNRNTELFQLKEFDVAIIDEASQILEIPTLMLVSRVKKFILVGDHKQLPAVVVQSKDESAVSPEVSDLLSQELGLTNLRNSYFERLYCLAEAKWTWACGTLKTQYRMHREIMDLVNHRFYGGVLTCGEDRQHQEGLGRDNWKAGRSKLSDWIRSRRVMFIPARRTDEDLSSKECHEEARLASQFALELCEGYGPAFDPAHTVGIIASYRNQVALIHRQLELLAAEHGKPELAKVTVDTVERFQGSQRAVIILSFCCHFDWQLEQLVADSEGNDEGQTVDRKLNVALTRAKDQLILLGSPEILAKASGYAGVLADIRAKGAMAEGAN